MLGIKLDETHDPVEDARIALYIAAKLLVSGPQKPIRRGEKKAVREARLRQISGDYKGYNKNAGKKGKSAVAKPGNLSELLVHRIPDYCTADHILKLIVTHTNIQPLQVRLTLISFHEIRLMVLSYRPAQVQRITRPDGQSKDAVGRTTLVFESELTANKAFNAIAGSIRPDKQRRAQKRIYLKAGGYICVRGNYSV